MGAMPSLAWACLQCCGIRGHAHTSEGMAPGFPELELMGPADRVRWASTLLLHPNALTLGRDGSRLLKTRSTIDLKRSEAS